LGAGRWDQLAHEVEVEEKDEKLEGDAALNRLFQQIYSNGACPLPLPACLPVRPLLVFAAA
jgi:hypothetical protein